MEEADGILYTEYKTYTKEDMTVGYPENCKEGFIRAAHIYDNSFMQVRQNFAIAGLLSYIQAMFPT